MLADIPRRFTDGLRNPLTSLGIAGLLIVAAIRVWFLPSEQRTAYLPLLAFAFSLFTWLIVEVKKWPYMQVDAVTAENLFEIHSQDGAFAVVAWVRILNRSSNTNAVLNGRYWLRVEGLRDWQPFSPETGPIEGWLRDRLKESPDAYLRLPEVYPPNTARVRCVAFCGRIAWQRQGDEKPRIWLKARFEMSEGSPRVAEVPLKWSSTLPSQLSAPLL